MKLLLDTHLLIWSAIGDETVDSLGIMPSAAAKLIDNPENTLFFSVASLWEVAIKSALRRPEFRVDPRELRRNLLGAGYQELAISGEHAVQVAGLAPLHKDPFDRLLIAQAMVENIVLLTCDRAIARYPGPIRKV